VIETAVLFHEDHYVLDGAVRWNGVGWKKVCRCAC
jgi:hypothetical protein